MREVVLDTYVSEQGTGRAEIKQNDSGLYIMYFDQNGKPYHSETFYEYSIHYVRDAADNLAKGIKTLNG